MYPGTDIIEIERIRKALQRQPQLKTRLFTPSEIAECDKKGNPAASYAGRFAAKEAVLKALGTGLRGVQWQEIEVLSNDLGEPGVRLSGNALQLAQARNIELLRVSISHSRDLAVAFVLALTEVKK